MAPTPPRDGDPGDQDPGRDPLDDDPDGDPDDDPDGDGGDPDDDGEEEYTPPTREEWEKTRRIAATRKQEKAALRARLRDAMVEIDRLKAGGDGDGGGTGGGSGDGDRDAREARWRRSAARNSAATAITAAGFSGSAKDAKHLTALIKGLDDAEPDDDGDYYFEDEVEELRERFPALFARTPDPDRQAPRRRPTSADRGAPRDAGDDPTVATSKKLLRSAGVPTGRRRG